MINQRMCAGIISTMMGMACTPKTTFLEYPITIDKTSALYTKSSNGDCYLNVLQSDGNELRIYDQGCDATADSVAKASPKEQFLFFHDREKLNTESRHYLDLLITKAIENLQEKDNLVRKSIPNIL